jgi:hypothetical protein
MRQVRPSVGLAPAALAVIFMTGCADARMSASDTGARPRAISEQPGTSMDRASLERLRDGAGAEPAAEAGEKLALLVGISKYADPAIPGLKHARADAQAVWSYFVDPAGLSIAPANAKLLVDEAATRERIVAAIGALNERARPRDTVIVYFACHGAVQLRRNGALEGTYLMPQDARAVEHQDRQSVEPASALALAELHRLLAANAARNLLLVLDACFSGGAPGSFSRVPLDPGQARQSDAEIEALAAEGREGRSVLTATSASQPALELDRLGHGLFTWHFLEGLRNDADRDGQVTLDEVRNWLSATVPQAARALGYQQTPALKENRTGPLVLRDLRARHRVGMEVTFADGARAPASADPPPRPQPIRAAGYSVRIDAWTPAPLNVYLLRIARTESGARTVRLLPDAENELSPPVTIADGRHAVWPDGDDTGATLAPVGRGEAGAHVVFVLIASVEPLDLALVDGLEARLRGEAEKADPLALARRAGDVVEAEPALRDAAIRYVFVRHEHARR